MVLLKLLLTLFFVLWAASAVRSDDPAFGLNNAVFSRMVLASNLTGYDGLSVPSTLTACSTLQTAQEEPTSKTTPTYDMLGEPFSASDQGYVIRPLSSINLNVAKVLENCFSMAMWARAGFVTNLAKSYMFIYAAEDAMGVSRLPVALGWKCSNATSSCSFFVALNDSSIEVKLPPAFDVPYSSNTAHHYAVVYCRGTLAIYVDGVLAVRLSLPDLEVMSNVFYMTIGSEYAGYDCASGTVVAHYALWNNQALGTSQIKRLYESRGVPTMPVISVSHPDFVPIGEWLPLSVVISSTGNSILLDDASGVSPVHVFWEVHGGKTFPCGFEFENVSAPSTRVRFSLPDSRSVRAIVSNGAGCAFVDIKIVSSATAFAIANSTNIPATANGTIFMEPGVPPAGELSAASFPPAEVSLQFLASQTYSDYNISTGGYSNTTADIWETVYSTYGSFSFSLLPKLASENGLVQNSARSIAEIGANVVGNRAEDSLLMRFVIDNGINQTIIGNYTLRFATPTTNSSGNNILPTGSSSSSGSSVILPAVVGGGGGVIVIVLFCCCCLLFAMCLLVCLCLLCCLFVVFVVLALLVVGAVSAAGAAGVAGSGVVAFRMSRKNKIQEEKYREMLAAIDERKELDMQEIRKRMEDTDTFREISIDELEFGKKIGSGAYGSVYLGLWQEAPVAIKVLNVADGLTEEAVEEFRHEATLMAKVSHHPNIVHFVGAAVSEDKLCLVTHFCKNGALQKLLETTKLDWDTKLRIARDSAAGLAFLHSQGIIHRDVAARNILVGENYECFISDFGYSRICESSAEDSGGTTKSNVGPVRWMAPEAMKDRVYGPKTDAYSFGMVLYEIAMDGLMPFYNDENLLDLSRKIVMDGYRPDLPQACPDVLLSLIKRLWDSNPKRRPSMKAVLRELAAAAGGETSAAVADMAAESVTGTDDSRSEGSSSYAAISVDDNQSTYENTSASGERQYTAPGDSYGSFAM